MFPLSKSWAAAAAPFDNVMIIIPALCTQCGTVFSSKAFEDVNRFGGVQIVGNHEPCPKCAGMANTLDGILSEALNGQIEFVPSPQVGLEVLKEFAALLQKAVRNEIGVEDLEMFAARLDEKLGELVRRFRSPHHDRCLLLLLLFAKSSGCSSGLKMDINQMIQQLRKWSYATTLAAVSAPPAMRLTIEKELRPRTPLVCVATK